MTPKDKPVSEPRDTAADRSPPSCLITGGSGFLGINLVRHMLQRGMRLRTLDIAPFDYPEHDRIDAWRGDIRDRVMVDKAMQGMTAVVHCAAALPLASAAEIMSTGVDGTRTLLEAALQHGVRRFIFTSSTAVYGIPEHHPIREDDALQGVGPYGQSKIQAERLCARSRSQGLCVTVLRPKTFIGPERLGVFEILYEWAFEGRRFPVLGRGDNTYQLLDVADLCEVIHRCMVLDAAVVNDVFNVGALDIGTMKENVQTVLDRAGRGRKAVCLPAAPAVLVLRILHALGLSPLYEWIYRTADRDSVVAIDRLRCRLGYTPSRSNRSALMANYDWYVQHRHEFRGHVGISHRTPWRKGALGWAKWCF